VNLVYHLSTRLNMCQRCLNFEFLVLHVPFEGFDIFAYVPTNKLFSPVFAHGKSSNQLNYKIGNSRKYFKFVIGYEKSMCF
jgi:hypothetical protein